MIKKQINFVYFLLLCALISGNALLSAQVTKLYSFSSQDSLQAIVDTVRTGFLADYRKNRHEIADVSLSLNSLFSQSAIFLISLDYKGYGSDLYEVSRELVDQYYSRKIKLYSYNDRGFLYLSLKDARNNNGLLQIRIPLGNLRELYDKHKHKHKRKK
jgi:hypothetical protein